jgi:hypothetical protein
MEHRLEADAPSALRAVGILFARANREVPGDPFSLLFYLCEGLT